MRTLELKYTLTPSHIDTEWISAFFIFQKANAPGLKRTKSFRVLLNLVV